MPPLKTCDCGVCHKCKQTALINEWRRKKRLGLPVNPRGHKYTKPQPKLSKFRPAAERVRLPLSPQDRLLLNYYRNRWKETQNA